MKVWHLISNRWNSAITEYALSLARAVELVGGHSVFSPLQASPAEMRARSYGLDTRPLPHFGMGVARTMADLSTKISADIIVTYGGPETFLVGWPTVRRRARVIRFRGQDIETSLVSGFKQRLSHMHVDCIITPSERLAAKMRSLDPTRRVGCLPLGCDQDRFKRIEKPTASDANAEIVVLGRFDPIKGHAYAMDLMRLLVTRRVIGTDALCLHIVGEPANLSQLQLEECARARGLSLGGEIKISAQRIDSVAELLSQAAIGLIPSLGSEIICRVAEEFLLCGTPIVVSGAGSLDETLSFDGAGATYAGLDLEGAVAILEQQICLSLNEGESAKRTRAEKARANFSLAAMGAGFARLVGGQSLSI